MVFRLKSLWLAMGQMCSKRMKEALPKWLPHYNHPQFNKDIFFKLIKMSSSSIDRLLGPYKAQFQKRRLTGTTSHKFIRNQIPLKPLQNKDYKDPEEAIQDVGDYIFFYNTEQKHSALEYKTPEEFEKKDLTKNVA